MLTGESMTFRRGLRLCKSGNHDLHTEERVSVMGATVFDRKRLARLLEELAVLSGMGVSFWHPEKNLCIVTTSNVPSPFCEFLQRKQAMRTACSECEHRALALCKSDYKTHYFTCHAGLTECISPVVYNGILLGFIMTGQIISPEDNHKSFEISRDWFESNGFDYEEVRNLYIDLPVVSIERQSALIHMIEALASFVYIEGMVQRIEFPILHRLDDYISAHINEQISLDSVAESLHVSKSTICHMLKSERNTTLTKLVNQRRIERVCLDLKEGKSITVAAAAAGFSSASYCSRVFLNIMGIRPETYLRDMQIKVDS